MTANQLTYWANQETKRHNLAAEEETQRSNVAREVETQRHNRVDERETQRSHKANEFETYRHNTRTENQTDARLEAETEHWDDQDTAAYMNAVGSIMRGAGSFLGSLNPLKSLFSGTSASTFNRAYSKTHGLTKGRFY